MTTRPRHRIDERVFGYVLWDSLTGNRIGVFDSRSKAEAEADRLSGRDDVRSGEVWGGVA